MRQLLSTALVACIVGALAGATVGAVAQAPAEPPVTTAGLNADSVDGRHAVKATSNKQARANRLVATDSKGFLPSNIVKAKWGLISGKPAFLADGVVGWNEVAGIPAGFADGSDNEGVTGITITTVVSPQLDIGPSEWLPQAAVCPAGARATGGGFFVSNSLLRVTDSFPSGGATGWIAYAQNSEMITMQLTTYAVCVSAAPSAAITTAREGAKPAKVRRGR